MTQQAREQWVPEDTFGDKLRRVRRALGLSQEAFAASLGPDVGMKALAAWEAGTRGQRDSVSLAKRVEAAHGVPAAWLLGLPWYDSNVQPSGSPFTLVSEVAA